MMIPQYWHEEPCKEGYVTVKYRIKKGVVLFRICGEYFLFPSQISDVSVPFIITVPSELLLVLNSSVESMNVTDLSDDIKKKISRLIRLGYLEAC